MSDHECVFVEEQEPNGRLILPPCIVCGVTAMDALDQLRRSDDERSYTIFHDDGPIALTETELLNAYMRLRDERDTLVGEWQTALTEALEQKEAAEKQANELAQAAYEYLAISTKLKGVHPNAFLRADKRLADALRASGVALVGGRER